MSVKGAYKKPVNSERDNFDDLVGERIESIRLARGMSRKKLGELTGIHVSTLSNMERGFNCLSLYCVCKVAEALEVSPCVLLQDTFCATRNFVWAVDVVKKYLRHKKGVSQ